MCRFQKLFALILCSLFVSAHAADDFTSVEIGPGHSGASTVKVGDDGYNLKGGGKDIWLAEDNFRFLYQKQIGDFDFRARIASLENTDEWAKAGLMVRQSLTPESEHAFVGITPSKVFVQFRPVPGDTESGPILSAPALPNQWVRIVRSGDKFITYHATDAKGANWNMICVLKFKLKDPVYAGMFVLSHNVETTCKAEFRSVNLRPLVADPTTATDIVDDPTAPPKATPPKAVARPAASLAPADKAVANGLAAAAAKLASDGKIDKAREMCYKSLANDENCAEALFELAKILDKDASPAAAAIMQRASQELGRLEGASPAMGAKRRDAETRLLRLNPHGSKFMNVLADYTAELNTITKKNSDSLTLDEACERADQLKLRAMLSPDKAPKFERPKAVAAADDKSALGVRRVFNGGANGPRNVPPDIEAALKAAGWTTIGGSWKKTGDKIYEVTDGKLECEKLNGAIQLIVHKSPAGASGRVQALVRNHHPGNYSPMGGSTNYATGFGFIVEGLTARIYCAGSTYNGSPDAAVDRIENLNEGSPKNLFTIVIDDGKMEYSINNVVKRKNNYPLSKSGPFRIQIDGTMTIENPQAKGQ